MNLSALNSTGNNFFSKAQSVKNIKPKELLNDTFKMIKNNPKKTAVAVGIGTGSIGVTVVIARIVRYCIEKYTDANEKQK